jgi:hypothetical protein
MHWFAVKQAIATNRKWMGLSMAERGAWISLMAIAAANHPRGTLPDRETAVALLEREGAANAAELVDSLVGKGWIDEADLLTMHDFDDEQLSIRKPSDRPEAVRERVKHHRESKREETDETKGKVSPDNAEQRVTDEPTPMIQRLANLYEAFSQLTGLPCTKQDELNIDGLCRKFDRDLVRRTMYADPEPSRNPSKFIGRVYFALKERTAA